MTDNFYVLPRGLATASTLKPAAVWLAVFSATFASGCTVAPWRLADPETDTTSLIIVSVVLNLRPQLVFLDRTAANGEREVVSSSQRWGKYYYFPNVYPGKYELLKAIYVDPSKVVQAPGPQVTMYYLTDPKTTLYEIPERLRAQSAIQVGRQAIYYIGEVTLQTQIMYHPTLQAKAFSRTDLDRKEAFFYFSQSFPDSNWLKYMPR